MKEEGSRSRSSHPRSLYKVEIPLQFLAWCVFTSVLSAFAVGRCCRQYLLKEPAGIMTPVSNSASHALPHPTLPEGKDFPESFYTSKVYNTDPSLTLSADNVLLKKSANNGLLQYETRKMGRGAPENWVVNESGLCEDSAKEDVLFQTPSTKDEEEHAPKGQHLLVDIENVDPGFLDSEARLATTMLELVNQSGLTLLSYHCHHLQPAGVSCVGVLLESHVSLHTFPLDGAIILDLFTCGPNSLIPVVPIIKSLFGIPQSSSLNAPRMEWTHKFRGYNLDRKPVGDSDVSRLLRNTGMQEKTNVVSTVTDFQTIDIFDTLDSRFVKKQDETAASSLSYEAQHPELFSNDRMVFMGGIMQSRRKGEAAYHEALVHPVMFSHHNPRRVIIIGGGEGATLREVLKHKTVEHVIMLEIDKEMVEVSKKHLPEWSDCSNLGLGYNSCFDDPRAEVIHTDAVAWLVSRFNDSSVDSGVDVIIMDALDASDAVPFCDTLYDNPAVTKAISNAVLRTGTFAAQVGMTDKHGQAARQLSNPRLESFYAHLAAAGFLQITEYTESHSNFEAPWNFVLAEAYHDFRLLYGTEAHVNAAIHRRILPTVDNKSSLVYFDGATMMNYQYPSRVAQNVFCRSTPTPSQCDVGTGFKSTTENVKLSALEVRPSKIPNAGRGVFFKEGVEQGSYLGIESTSHNIILWPQSVSVVDELAKRYSSKFGILPLYMYAYGFAADAPGGDAMSVDVSILTFTNHGCNGTNTIGTKGTTEFDVDPVNFPSAYSNERDRAAFQPLLLRGVFASMSSTDVLNHDVVAGDELLDNYLDFAHVTNWEFLVADLRKQCSGAGVGSVVSYERTSQK